MHTPLWIKIGMALGFAYLGLFSINLIGDMLGAPGDQHGGTHGGEHATTEEIADAGHDVDTGMSEADTSHEDAADEAADDMTGEHAAEVVAALVGDAAAGAKTAKKKCGTCHTFGSGEGHKVGPNLFGVTIRGRAAAEGYRYSANMTAMGGSWSDADLDIFLTDPKAFVAGTKMSLMTKKEQERADLIAFVKTLQ